MRWLQRLMGRTEFAGNEPSAIAEPRAEIAGAFRFDVDDVVVIAGRGTVAIGTVRQGTARVGDTVEVRGARLRVDGVEALGRPLAATRRGEAVGLVFEHGDIARGDVVAGV